MNTEEINNIKYRFISKFIILKNDPIIIYGNQKSGTSVITALLGTVTGESYCNDLFFRMKRSYKKLFDKRISLLKLVNENKYYFSKRIIKDADLIFFNDRLTEIFPNAQYVFIIRDPRENIRSILDRLDISGKNLTITDFKITHLKKNLPIWYEIIKGDIYNHSGNNHIESLAKRWDIMSQIYLQNRAKMILVKYEDFTESNTKIIEELAQKLNLKCKNNIEIEKKIQYQPRGKNRGVPFEEFFNKKNLEIIENICKKNMVKFGYY